MLLKYHFFLFFCGSSTLKKNPLLSWWLDSAFSFMDIGDLLVDGFTSLLSLLQTKNQSPPILSTQNHSKIGTHFRFLVFLMWVKKYFWMKIQSEQFILLWFLQKLLPLGNEWLENIPISFSRAWLIFSTSDWWTLNSADYCTFVLQNHSTEFGYQFFSSASGASQLMQFFWVDHAKSLKWNYRELVVKNSSSWAISLKIFFLKTLLTYWSLWTVQWKYSKLKLACLLALNTKKISVLIKIGWLALWFQR